MYNLLILLASFLLVLATGVLLKPVPAAGEVPVAPLDRDVAFRVSIAALVISCLLVAGLIAAYSAHPETFRWAVARPLDRMLDRYYWVMFAGAGLYVIVRLCGAKSRWSLWVLCLSLPGALTFPRALPRSRSEKAAWTESYWSLCSILRLGSCPSSPSASGSCCESRAIFVRCSALR